MKIKRAKLMKRKLQKKESILKESDSLLEMSQLKRYLLFEEKLFLGNIKQ